MGKYLDLIEAADRARRSPTRTPLAADRNTASGVADNGKNPMPLTAGPETHSLLAAGWRPKVRLGKTIWQRPDTGFWVSQEVALYLLESKSREEDQRS